MMNLYRLAMALALPVLLGRTAWAERLRRLPKGALAERRGVGVAPADVWLHAASMGEAASARPLIDALLAARPGLRVGVTCNTATARALVRGWGMAGVTATLAPLDAPGPVARFLDSCSPALSIQIEGEFWPERLAQCAARGIPVAVLGARLSERSAHRWARLAPELMRRMLGGVRLLSAQDAGSEARFVALGLPQDRLAVRHMLKAQVVAGAVALPFPPPVPRGACLLAASTHEGDDARVLDAFVAAGRFAHLILAPRHPRRGDAVVALARARGLTVAQRSKGEVPGLGCAVHVADTTGEMAAWYAMAGVTVIGGTFDAWGGHTPYEPAAHGSAIIHGPDVANFAEAFAVLAAVGGAVAMLDAGGLAGALAGLDESTQARLAAAATRALAAGPIPEALVQAILSLIPASG